MRQVSAKLISFSTTLMSDPFPAVPALGLQAELLLHRFLECDISTDTISVSFSR